MDPMTSQDLSLPGPPVVYLPVELDHEGHVTDIRMIKLADGRVALLGYTALDRLMDCCGEQQPWLLVESSKLADVGEQKHFDVKFLDVSLPPELRFQAVPA